MQEINSKKVREEKQKILTEEVSKLERKPRLVIVQVEGDDASTRYVNNKKKLGNEIGIIVEHVLFKSDVTEHHLKEYITFLNDDSEVDGIIVQLPLPSHINEHSVTNTIDYTKDVDGLTEKQMGMLLSNNEKALYPCTALGVVNILESLINVEGLDVVVVNRSHLIGKPLQAMLTNMNATVTVCHSKTKNLKEKMRNADVVITGIGKAEFFDSSYFTDFQIIIDCSMNFKNGKLCGDVNVEDLKCIDSYVASGKGHTGPSTVLSLIENTIKAYKLKNN